MFVPLLLLLSACVVYGSAQSQAEDPDEFDRLMAEEAAAEEAAKLAAGAT